jgi:hypothetical protein
MSQPSFELDTSIIQTRSVTDSANLLGPLWPKNILTIQIIWYPGNESIRSYRRLDFECKYFLIHYSVLSLSLWYHATDYCSNRSVLTATGAFLSASFWAANIGTFYFDSFNFIMFLLDYNKDDQRTAQDRCSNRLIRAKYTRVRYHPIISCLQNNNNKSNFELPLFWCWTVTSNRDSPIF